MKKAFRFVLSVILLAALGISEVPAPAACQMAYGNFMASGCRMPCCQTKLPMPKCPMLKASAPHDFIASSIPIFDSTLVPLQDSLRLISPLSDPLFQLAFNLATTLHFRLAGPPLSVRAPPSNVHLLDA